MKNEQKITCPSCQQAEIIFDTYALLQGVKFVCPNCNAQIGLSQESHNQVQATMKEFDRLKSTIKK